MATESPPRTRLEHLRRSLGLRVEDLADRSGVAARTIRALEVGEHDPKLGTARRIVAALGAARLETVFPPDEPRSAST